MLVSIGKKYNKSSAQVALRFNVQRGVVVIPKSFSAERIKHNFQVYLSAFLSCQYTYVLIYTHVLIIQYS